MVKKIVLESVELYDAVSWMVVILFFLGSAVLFSGDVAKAYLGASGIIVLMFLISVSIEITIETLQDVKGLGTIIGFITNGPEALCLIVGLITGNILFAASTPLGSNFMNPILLVVASLITGKLLIVLQTERRYTILTILVTASVASGFYLLKPSQYPAWVALVLVVSSFLFWKRPPEQEIAHHSPDESGSSINRAWVIPAILTLVFSGYFLDEVVSFTSEYSRAPKEIVGFVILSMLTSWPEFKSCMSLLKRQKYLASVLNITVSNITNLWLAIVGVSFWLFTT